MPQQQLFTSSEGATPSKAAKGKGRLTETVSASEVKHQLDLSCIAPTHRRVIIALDIDAFYVAAARLRDPTLVGLPIGIKQKGLLATVSYEGRAMGVKKLASIRDALKQCPQMILVNGEDLSYFRKVSSLIFTLMRRVVWDEKVEKLGMDELFCDVSDMIDAHLQQRQPGTAVDLEPGMAFFDLRRHLNGSGLSGIPIQGDLPPDKTASDPHRGFWYNPGELPGYVLPNDDTTEVARSRSKESRSIYEERLIIGSHLALHLRRLIESEVGLTLSAGVSHCKMASKLVGAAHKPNQHTCWLPPSQLTGTNTASSGPTGDGNLAEQEAIARDAYLTNYLRPLDIRKINGFGAAINAQLKSALKEDRTKSTNTKAASDSRHDHPGRREPAVGSEADTRVEGQRWWDDPPEYQPITVDLALKAFSLPFFEEIFGTRLGSRLWGLLHGQDDEPVQPSPEFPSQISIEDTYRGIKGDEIARQIDLLSNNLLKRLETELVEGGTSKEEVLQPTVRRRDDYIHEQGFDGVVRSYFDVEEDEVVHATKLRNWKRFPLGLRLGTRLGWGVRTTRQTKMPVGIFELSKSRRYRANLIAHSCMAMLRATLGDAYRGEGLNLLNIAALDLSKSRPEQSIAAMWSAGASPKQAPKLNSRNGTLGSEKHSREEEKAMLLQGIDPDVFAQLPADVQADILRSLALPSHEDIWHADGASRSTASRTLPTASLVCPTCHAPMLVFMQHDHETWPATGLPPKSLAVESIQEDALSDAESIRIDSDFIQEADEDM